MPASTVRLSTKGQIVIPAELRRSLGLEAGRLLQIRRGKGGEVILTATGDTPDDLDGMLARIRAAAAAEGRDLVEELHRGRASERLRERGGA